MSTKNILSDDLKGHKDLIASVRNVSKKFGAVTALDAVSFGVRRGDITALVGDNGAGKSTLVRLLCGASQPTEGEIAFDGRSLKTISALDARQLGIETVYQDLALAPQVSVWANIFMGREYFRGPSFLRILDRPRMIAQAKEMLSRFKMNVPPLEQPVGKLSGGQRQLVAIARAAAWSTKLIVLDEPTAALGVAETAAVEETVKSIHDSGQSILIVSHNLEQVFRLADRIVVLRRGRYIATLDLKKTNPDEVVGLITGAISRKEI